MKQGRLWHWRFIVHHHLGHHLLIAASLTSMVFLAKHIGMTRYLDGLTIHVSQGMLFHANDNRVKTNSEGALPARCEPQSNQECGPALIVITPENYRDVFNNTSPLSRDLLADGLERLLKSKPRAILIDLDLAPSTTEYNPGDKLDNILDAGDKNTLVLITPILQEVDTKAEEWVRQRCEKGSEFAFNSLKREFGVVIDYSESYQSLGVAARALNPQLQSQKTLDRLPTICAQLDLLRSARDPIPQQLSQDSRLPKNLTDLDRRQWQYAFQKDTNYINWKKTQNIEPIDWKTLLSADEDDLAKSFDNRLVFVGAMYDPHDWFLSPLGPRSGVQTHMAIATSTLLEGHVGPFISEVFLGILLGILGVWSFKTHQKIRNEHMICAVHTHLTTWGHAYRFSIRGMLVILPAIVGLFSIALFVWFTVRWLAQGVWLNPVPLAIGMLLHVLMMHDDPPKDSNMPPVKSRQWLCLVQYPARVFLLPLVGLAIFLLLMESIH